MQMKQAEDLNSVETTEKGESVEMKLKEACKGDSNGWSEVLKPRWASSSRTCDPDVGGK